MPIEIVSIGKALFVIFLILNVVMQLSRYNFILHAEEYAYWYNAFTNRYFRLSRSLSHKVEPLLQELNVLAKEVGPLWGKLLENGFVIEDEADELAEIRAKYQEAVHAKNYFLVVLPTLNCNFKCWYCIQDHVPSVMKAETMEALKRHIDYMIEVCGITSLRLDWFGGEPFMFFRQIVEPISRYAIRKCEKHGIPFINSSTTNGYFLTPSVSALLTELKFAHFQITLDGEKAFHDRVKFMPGCPSAFEHVLQNINYMLSENEGIRLFLRINYTHQNLSFKIISEVNEFIVPENRSRIVITPRKVWQEKVDKSFGDTLEKILDAFADSGYGVSRWGIVTDFLPCYVNKEYYNAVNFNGNVVKCTACNDLYETKPKGRLLEDGRIVWEDGFDKKCQLPAFENERCLSCKRLPVCMGLCPRNHLSGATFCKYDAIDDVFEEKLLDFLEHQYD